MSEENPQRRNGNGTPSRSGPGPPGWQTAVMVLVAFIVGLIPYVATQGKWATKDEVTILRDRQADIALQVAKNSEHIAAHDQQLEELQQMIEVLRQRIDVIQGVYGPTTGGS